MAGVLVEFESHIADARVFQRIVYLTHTFCVPAHGIFRAREDIDGQVLRYLRNIFLFVDIADAAQHVAKETRRTDSPAPGVIDVFVHLGVVS